MENLKIEIIDGVLKIPEGYGIVLGEEVKNGDYIYFRSGKWSEFIEVWLPIIHTHSRSIQDHIVIRKVG